MGMEERGRGRNGGRRAPDECLGDLLNFCLYLVVLLPPSHVHTHLHTQHTHTHTHTLALTLTHYDIVIHSHTPAAPEDAREKYLCDSGQLILGSLPHK